MCPKAVDFFPVHLWSLVAEMFGNWKQTGIEPVPIFVNSRGAIAVFCGRASTFTPTCFSGNIYQKHSRVWLQNLEINAMAHPLLRMFILH